MIRARRQCRRSKRPRCARRRHYVPPDEAQVRHQTESKLLDRGARAGQGERPASAGEGRRAEGADPNLPGSTSAPEGSGENCPPAADAAEARGTTDSSAHAAAAPRSMWAPQEATGRPLKEAVVPQHKPETPSGTWGRCRRLLPRPSCCRPSRCRRRPRRPTNRNRRLPSPHRSRRRPCPRLSRRCSRAAPPMPPPHKPEPPGAPEAGASAA